MDQYMYHPQPMQLQHNISYSEYYWGRQETTLSYWLSNDRGPMPAVFDGQPPHIMDGEAFFSHAGSTPVTVIRFSDPNVAETYINRQHNRDACVSETEAFTFLGTHRFSCWTHYFVDVVYNKLPTETVYTWFHPNTPKLLFEYNNDGSHRTLTMEPMGLRPEVRNVLKSFLDGLRKLHDNQCCHGNVQFGIWFSASEDVHVKFLNFGETPSNLANGIIDDLCQFSELVKQVITHNPADRPSNRAPQAFPHSYVRFMKHIEHLQQVRGMDLEVVRRHAYFVYNQPLFVSPAANFKMLRNIFSIKRQDQKCFDNCVSLLSMNKWHKHIHPGHYLWNDFDQKSKTYKSGPTYLLDFHVNAVKHHNQNNPSSRIQNDDEVIQELYRCFPKFASEIYYEYAMTFNSDIYPWMQSNDKLLQRGPNGVK